MQKPKKLLSFLLTIIICFSAIPLSAMVVSAETIKMGYISGEDVNIRKDATTSSDRISTVSKWTVSVLGTKNDTLSTINPETEAVYKWYQISYTSQSQTIKGYIREDLIEIKELELDSSFSNTLKSFPESYHRSLTILHALYPEWKFEADKVENSFSDSVIAQDKNFTKLVTTNYNSLRSMREGCYDWSKKSFITSDSGNYGASREVIAYYMDPRNFLNANDIYVFMQQSFDKETQTKNGVEKIIDGTYLDAKITNSKDSYLNKTYSTVIMKAAEKSKVNPYVLASTLIQEQGSKGSTLSKGTKYKNTTVYNFFNYGASGSTKEEVLENGKKYAYEQGWTTPSKALINGAVKYGSGYIAIGQDTYFYKNYNVLNPEKLWHQYAQSVHDSLSSSRFLKTNYADYKDLEVTFRIPVYENMPKNISKFPSENNKLNNYYFSSIEAKGLTPSFNMYINDYTLETSSDIDVYIKLPTDAQYTGERTHNLKKGTNKVKLTVKSQTGYSRTYTITVTANASAKLTVKQLGETLIKEADGKYYHYIDGERTKITTLVKYNGKYYYVKKGVHSNENTFVNYNDKEYYVENGIRTSKTGFVEHKKKYYRIEKGVRSSKDNYTKYNDLYLKLSDTKLTYTGKSQTPAVEVYDSKGNKLSSKYYTYTYSGNTKNVGKYKVTVKLKDKYSGTVKLYFKINPKGTKVTGLTAAKKSLKVKIKKQTSQSTGYEIQYSTSKTFKNSKTKTVKNNKTTSVTLKSLTAKKTYYVRIRTYKTVKDKKYYSDWSATRSKKTK